MLRLIIDVILYGNTEAKRLTLLRQAKAEGGDICFWDESGFRADALQGKTWGRQGQTPVVPVPGQRQSISAASAVSPMGAFWFATYKGA